MEKLIKKIDTSKITTKEYCDIYNKYYMYNILKCLKICNYKFLDPQNIHLSNIDNALTIDWLFPTKNKGLTHPNYFVEECKGKAQVLAYDIIENGMYAPLYVQRINKDEFTTIEGMHRVLSFRFLYGMLEIETDIKLLSYFYDKGNPIDTPLKTNFIKYRDNKIILDETKTLEDLIRGTVSIDMGLLNNLRNKLNYKKPSKFYTDENLFNQIIKEVNWDKMEKDSESNIVIAE